jgi:hypothetical protein
MVVVIVIKKEYPSLQDAVAQWEQAEAMGFKLVNVEVSAE